MRFEHSNSLIFQILIFCFLVNKHHPQEANITTVQNYMLKCLGFTFYYCSAVLHTQTAGFNSHIEICKVFKHLCSVTLTSMPISF